MQIILERRKSSSGGKPLLDIDCKFAKQNYRKIKEERVNNGIATFLLYNMTKNKKYK
jgi:hypothetical protein